MHTLRRINAEDLARGDYIFEGLVLRVEDNYESLDFIDVYVEGEDEPIVFRCDDQVDILDSK